jgi:hypothetical protein
LKSGTLPAVGLGDAAVEATTAEEGAAESAAGEAVEPAVAVAAVVGTGVGTGVGDPPLQDEASMAQHIIAATIRVLVTRRV